MGADSIHTAGKSEFFFGRSFDIDSALYIGQEQQPEGFFVVASLCGACSDIH